MNKSKKILVVDNNPVVLQFMTKLLEKHGHEVKTANDGLSALGILKNYVPDIMFIDMIMPNINGEKLCRIVHGTSKLKNVYIVILSALAPENNFNEIHADAYIAKDCFDTISQNVLLAVKQSELKSRDKQPEKINNNDNYPLEIINELLSSKRHWELILDNISEGIFELADKTNIIYANPAAVSLIDIPEEKLLASDFTKLFSETDYKKIANLLNNIDDSPSAIKESFPLLSNDKQVELNILSIKDSDWRKSIIVILNDVTDQKRLQAQLMHNQKMQAIGALAGGIAHDFNNLLMGIQCNVSLMLMDIDSENPNYKMLNDIESLIQTGAKLTKQLLGYARREKYALKFINLNDVIIETVKAFCEGKKEISIHYDLAQDLCEIKADRSKIERTLFNLLKNAWRAMHGIGDIFLETSNVPKKEIKNKFYNSKYDRYVRLCITDKGDGMDNHTLERIFDPFFTTQEMGRGTGLGLAYVYGIIKSHDGYIDAESKKGHGSTFNIYLPISEKQIT